MIIKRLLIRTFLSLFFTLALSLSLALFWGWNWLNESVSLDEHQQVFVIGPGESLYSVSARLHRLGLMKWPLLWVNYARLTERSKIYAGEYALTENESPLSLLALFQSHKVVQHSIVLVEGYRFSEIVDALHAHPKIKKTLTSKSVDQVIKGVEVAHLEGWFFPDTYYFTAGESDVGILLRAHKKMKSVLADLWQLKASELPYREAYDALIMASIVEKETGAPHEREQIAGVFIRRLFKNMRLQTDPTVIYGMGDQYNGNITRADLKRPTPYNTYTVSGLPPTPIAMPGREAIYAALHPKEGNSLYFVAKGDGTHYFSSTLAEHNSAVRRFQLKRREKYQSNFNSVTAGGGE